ncbi:probable acyl-activating enzyme 12, peroxisomal [Punica granatum]|uniref:Uncharacterized protein n=2 Tax=Punica granatum TaxID=22663 RepID=A0A2I0GBI7_PUNGR|nr:probable acyl-activating enzyme 12, peroxisomal [Punica granatum]PKH47785.1 hypothetical protein CRG98_050440 [Punica granatum]
MDRLPKCGANYVPLSPLTFLKRAAAVYSHRTSIVYEGSRFTWCQTYERCCRLASSLRSFNILKNDVVSVLAPNIPAMYEMHFAVPMAGAVLNTINTRLDANNIAAILRHSKAKLFFVDCHFVALAHEAVSLLVKGAESPIGNGSCSMPLFIIIDDANSATGVRLGELEYEELIQRGNVEYVGEMLQDEWDPIALNYTSGTTSEPKGVVYSHRGAYLSTLSLLLGWEMGNGPVYLWTLPMFHCNGWTFTWGIAARGGTNICLRNPTASNVYHNIKAHDVTHMCCAPVVLNILLEGKPREEFHLTSPVHVLIGGAPPPAPLLGKIESLGFQVSHAYGLTEATGPALVCEWQAQWDQLPQEERAKLKARQGIGTLTLADVDVKDPQTLLSVPCDGKTKGEIALRGSSLMKGYFRDEEATSKAFRNDCFLTGDVAVVHPDGYLEIKDRLKDIIISGGENISSVELENVLYRHPRVLEAAVVAMSHPRWGESPCAFITTRPNSTGRTDDVNEGDIMAYCRRNLPHFMVPKWVEFLPELPKTSTGKIKKFQLRALAKNFKVGENISEKKTDQVPAEVMQYRSQSREQVLASSRL